MKKQKFSYYNSTGLQYVFAENEKEAEKLLTNACGVWFIPEQLRNVEFTINE